MFISSSMPHTPCPPFPQPTPSACPAPLAQLDGDDPLHSKGDGKKKESKVVW